MQLSNERLTTTPGSDTGDVNELTRIGPARRDDHF